MLIELAVECNNMSVVSGTIYFSVNVFEFLCSVLNRFRLLVTFIYMRTF